MATRYIGQPIKRNEDPRLLTGRGTYVDDIKLPGMLHGALLRSPHAHARILGIDVSAARQMAELVWTAEDLGDLGAPLDRLLPLQLFIPHKALKHPRVHPALAKDKVRYVGEPVALVVAGSRYQAEDALEAIRVDYEPLPAVVNPEAGASSDAPRVHEDVEGNVAADFFEEVGNVGRAFAEADLVYKERLHIDRGCGQPMETRGVVAQFDPRLGSLTVWISTQAPTPIWQGLVHLFKLPPHRIRVIAPDVGGGFGPKVMIFYPEEVLIPLAAMRLGRPVKWIEDRREHFLATNHEREQIHYAEIAMRRDGTILGLRDLFYHDTGAYTPYGLIVPHVTATGIPGPYKVPNYSVRFRAVYTNKTPVSPYRGAGRPHAVFVMERLLDHVARELSLDPVEIRSRNLIQPHEFPYDVGVKDYGGDAPFRYDSGNYPACLKKAVEAIGYEAFRRTQPTLRASGRYPGIGVVCFVELTGVGPYEGAKVRVEPSGRVFVATGGGSQGQGHETILAQVAAEALGVEVSQVTVVSGDSDAFAYGIGTFASRMAVVAGTAVHLAARAVREKVLDLAAQALEAPREALELSGGRVYVQGAPARSLTLAEVEALAHPFRRAPLVEASEPGLEATRFFRPSASPFSNGVHALHLEVDPELGTVEVKRYVAVDDCGRILNPMILKGQIQGGVAQGVGGAFYEKLVYDENGQLLTTSFMDYLLPTASEVPKVEVEHHETPSPLNPLGVKGAGESGAIPVPALFAQAIEDALSPLGVRVSEMPLSPNRLRALIREATRSAKAGRSRGRSHG